ncbi:hypothetical protein [Streptomyces sp. DASNCL29]|uniref:hypothetical protein n=1 Tax=Streptomyces sp. DASNCL29 TaxID=2583819 RepID=UPI00110FAC76|nr:hypothetical protein [Streptomyces sp. DASNCL29]TMU96478.1 hypothetical protein FGK60_00070 [Streptomyces sp. DASNCL29]
MASRLTHLVIRCDAGNPDETEGRCGSEGSWPIRVENHTELQLAGLGVRLLRPVRKGEPERAGSALFESLRQLIESIRPCRGSRPRRATTLALTAAIWHNHHTGQPVIRSLTGYDH